MCFAWISEQTAIISLYSITLSVVKTKAESVYRAVRTGSLNQTDTVSYLKGYCRNKPTGADSTICRDRNHQTLHSVKYSAHRKMFHINVTDLKDIYTFTSHTIFRRMNHLNFFFRKLGTEFRFFIQPRYLMITVFRYVTPYR